MDERRAKAWNALGIGPVWRLRSGFLSSVSETGNPASSVAERADEPICEPIHEPIHEPAAQSLHEAQDAAIEPDSPIRALDGLDWGALAEAVAQCKACGLCRGRTQTVFGIGDPNADWLVVGEAPGAEEDRRGEPFVGNAGQLLDAMLAAVGLRRGQGVYIANVLKCRPPGNRNPLPEEVERCQPYLHRQVALIRPRIILVLGRFAAQSLLGTDASIARLRGQVHRYRHGGLDVPVVVSYHPAYLLRNLPDKAKSWADLCLARATVLAPIRQS
ncbi:MAG: uracil-DNA glycosylase [Burkholderiaceae bacterium]|nr:uracil-DNA glycosylase [Burkholderiaceae bacterium]